MAKDDSDNDDNDINTTKIIYRRKHESELFGIPINTLLAGGALLLAGYAAIKSNGNGEAKPQQPLVQPAPASQPLTEEQQRQNALAYAQQQEQIMQEQAAQVPASIGPGVAAPPAEFSMNSVRDGVYKRYKSNPKSNNGPFMTVA